MGIRTKNYIRKGQSHVGKLTEPFQNILDFQTFLKFL